MYHMLIIDWCASFFFLFCIRPRVVSPTAISIIVTVIVQLSPLPLSLSESRGFAAVATAAVVYKVIVVLLCRRSLLILVVAVASSPALIIRAAVTVTILTTVAILTEIVDC